MKKNSNKKQDPSCSSNATCKKCTDLKDSLKTSVHQKTSTGDEDKIRAQYEPNPKPPTTLNGNPIPAGAVADTTTLGLKYGIPDSYSGVCADIKPHFNWIVATCDNPDGPRAQFCSCLPNDLQTSTKINYVAAYQFVNEQGKERWELMDDSSCGDIDDKSISGNFNKKSGWEANKSKFQWQGGDWRTKYSPSSKDGKNGPRGGTPPASMYILSADNFAYAAWFFLSQLNLNLQNNGNPGGSNCWMWEYDPVEGTAGWIGGFDSAKPNTTLPGGQSINVLYNSSSAQFPSSMLVPLSNKQNNFDSSALQYPEYFKDYCAKKPQDGMCDLSKMIITSGGAASTTRMQNKDGQPYVFIVVIDQQGYWLYRYIPGADGNTPWKGIGQYQADKTITTISPPIITDPNGLNTNIAQDTPAAVMLLPSVASSDNVAQRTGAEVYSKDQRWLAGCWSSFSDSPVPNWWLEHIVTGQGSGKFGDSSVNYPATISGLDASDPSNQLNQDTNTLQKICAPNPNCGNQPCFGDCSESCGKQGCGGKCGSNNTKGKKK